MSQCAVVTCGSKAQPVVHLSARHGVKGGHSKGLVMRMVARSRTCGAQVAELAGIMGAKHTCFLIPLCHNISLKCGRTDSPHVNLKSCLLLRT